MTKSGPIGCEEALRRLAEYLDRELVAADDGAVKAHMDTCRACFSRTEFERRLKGRLQDLGSEPAPSEVQDRIRRVLGNF